MSRLATPPRFALPSVEAGQNDRELIYTTDSASVIRSPFMPQLADFNALSDASPAPALSPMNPTATLPGGNTAVDPKVLSGAWKLEPHGSSESRALCIVYCIGDSDPRCVTRGPVGICKTAGFQLPDRGKSPSKSEAALFYQALNSPQVSAPILGPMCRNTSPPRTGLQDRDGSDTESVSSDGLGIDMANDALMRSYVPTSSSDVRQGWPARPGGLLACMCCLDRLAVRHACSTRSAPRLVANGSRYPGRIQHPSSRQSRSRQQSEMRQTLTSRTSQPKS